MVKDFVMPELKKYPIIFKGQSLLGISGTPPFSHANYFWLQLHPEKDYKSVRVINMWKENLEAAKSDFLDDDCVEGYIFNDNFFVVFDKRIPEEYYYNKLCFTGGGIPSIETLYQIYQLLGDPTFEFEQFTNPESYYKKRGARYKNGTITYHFEGSR